MVKGGGKDTSALKIKKKFMKFSVPRGTKDILPQEAKLYHDLEEKARYFFNIFNYKEIRTPIFEEAKLFQRSLGQTTEVVNKQLIRLKAQGDGEDLDEFVLRPEATASNARVYIEHIHPKEGFGKFFYIGPMFRGERPQKGRLREFTHIGAEAMGVSNPYLDAEIISLAVMIIGNFGVEGYNLKINNLGCIKDKEKWSKLLKSALKDKIKNFCDPCQKRYNRNVFRILDCKNEKCKDALKNIKLKDDHICPDCKDYFQKVKKTLDILKIRYIEDPFLVRGLDYYTRTVFEITHSSLGSQDALGAGGRYDNLISQLGGPDLGAVGFALGLERVILTIKKKTDIPDTKFVYIVSLDEKAYEKGFLLLDKLRKEGISCDINYEGSSLKSQMRSANKAGAKFAIIIGEEEIKSNAVSVKDMSTGKQERINSNQIVDELKNKL